MRQISGEDHEVRVARQRVDGCDRFSQRVFRIGVRRTLKAPVGIAELDEEEVVGLGAFENPRAGSGEAGSKDGSAHSQQLDELAPRFHETLRLVHRGDSKRCLVIPGRRAREFVRDFRNRFRRRLFCRRRT